MRTHSVGSFVNPFGSHPRRSQRRARLCGLYFALLVIQLINASFYLVPNVCNFWAQCREGQLVDWAGVSWQIPFMPPLLIIENLPPHLTDAVCRLQVLRWTCWNSSCACHPPLCPGYVETVHLLSEHRSTVINCINHAAAQVYVAGDFGAQQQPGERQFRQTLSQLAARGLLRVYILEGNTPTAGSNTSSHTPCALCRPRQYQ